MIRSRQRVAFTLIELLAVITVIALLTTILVVTVRGVLTTARERGTQATLIKISGFLDERMRGLSRHIQKLDGAQFDNTILREQVRKDKPLNNDSESADFNPTYQGVQGIGYRLDAARILAKKDMFLEAFPQRFSEIRVSQNNDGSWTMMTTNDLTQPVNAAAESAETLYYLVTGEPIPNSGTPPISLRVPGVTPVGRDSFNTSEYGDTDNDGRLEFIDSWGNPLRFYRWPTRLLKPLGNEPENANDPKRVVLPADRADAQMLMRSLPGPADLNRDTDDPLACTASAKNFETRWHTPQTYHTLLVVSAGADGVLGLYEPVDTANFGNLGSNKFLDADRTNKDISNLTDDLSNLNAKAGGN